MRTRGKESNEVIDSDSSKCIIAIYLEEGMGRSKVFKSTSASFQSFFLLSSTLASIYNSSSHSTPKIKFDLEVDVSYI